MALAAVAILCTWLINRSADVRTSILGLLYALVLFILWHLVRVPWTLYKHFGEAESLKTKWGIAGVVFTVFALSMILWTAAWFYTMQPRIDLGKRPDGRDERILQLQQQLAALKEPESPDSLRHRTAKVADEFREYIKKRVENRPMPDAWPNSNDPNPTPERQAAIKRSQNYARETEDYYVKHFRDRMVGIIKEYESKGVPVHFLENDFKQRVPGIAEPGSAWEGMDELSRFRELAYRIDARDHLIVF
jgi:hypothetical protein